MTRWMVALVGLTLALAMTAGVVFALTGDGTPTPQPEPQGPVDEPSGNLPPIRSDEDIDPNECNWVHNITACGDEGLDSVGPVDEPSDEGRAQYEVTVRFNTSITQDGISEVEALLRTFDPDLQFVIMEIFPPIGRAVLATDEPNFCESVEAELEAKSYVDDASCQPWQEPDPADPDAPVSNDNDMGS